MMSTNEKAVLIIEDHRFVAEATESLISKNKPELKVLVCSTAEEALNTLNNNAHEWQLILLDLDVPGAIGLSLAMEIKKLGLEGKTCILTGTFRQEFVAHAKKQGFLGYVLKATATKQLEESLQRVIAGECVFFEDATQSAANPIPVLTQRQQETLHLVAQGKSSKEIARILVMQPRTVDKHIEAIMLELGVNKRAHAIQKALQLGLLRVVENGSAETNEN
jgi:two-component system, NarL family, response regulator DesR